jgi:hypothetical protein
MQRKQQPASCADGVAGPRPRRDVTGVLPTLDELPVDVVVRNTSAEDVRGSLALGLTMVLGEEGFALDRRVDDRWVRLPGTVNVTDVRSGEYPVSAPLQVGRVSVPAGRSAHVVLRLRDLGARVTDPTDREPTARLLTHSTGFATQLRLVPLYGEVTGRPVTVASTGVRVVAGRAQGCGTTDRITSCRFAVVVASRASVDAPDFGLAARVLLPDDTRPGDGYRVEVRRHGQWLPLAGDLVRATRVGIAGGVEDVGQLTDHASTYALRLVEPRSAPHVRAFIYTTLHGIEAAPVIAFVQTDPLRVDVTTQEDLP